MGDLTTDHTQVWTTLGITDGGAFVITETLVTIGEAMLMLDPPMPRRSLARTLSKLTPAGTRLPKQGGPPAKTYRLSDIRRAHADWVNRKPPGS